MTFKKIDLRTYKIDETTSDLRLASNIYTNSGIMIAPKDTRLDTYMIGLMLKHGRTIITVWFKAEREAAAETSRGLVDSEREVERVKFVENYTKVEEQIVEVLDSVRAGKPIDIDKTYEMTSNMIDNMRNKNDIFLYMNHIRDYDGRTASHSNHVALVSNVFGRWLGLTKDDLAVLTVGGVLHDVGKIEVPQEIINKPGKLTRLEYEIVKEHTERGYQLLKKRDLPVDAVMGVYSHHERNDGSGYPRGLKGDEINVAAKAIAIVDIFEAMTTNRPYREAICPFDVIRTLEVGMYGDLDTELLLTFLKNIANNYVGGNVVLSDGTHGKVVFINPNNITRPIIQTVDDRFIDLTERANIKVVSLT
jgi:putative nucleotidyltransferase with HDIG domain